jgi:hypothetical protein
MAVTVALVVVVGLVIVAIGCVRMTIRKVEAFEVQFPALTDAEFVARCAPGIDPDVALRVRRVLAECLNIECERIHPSARLVEDLGAY